MTNPKQTTVIFVPGAWHSPDCFKLVGNLLENVGYQTGYVHLPSIGPEKTGTGLVEDAARIRSHVEPAVEAGQDVVMVMHSYGGVPTQDAIQGLDKVSRSKQNKTGGVCHLVFCCSFIIDEGQSVVSAFGGKIPPWSHLSDSGDEMFPNTPEETFYNDLDDAQAKSAAAKLKAHSAETAKGIVKYAAWRHIPSTYVYCLKDQAIPYEIQKMMVEQTAGGAGIQFRTETLDASHSPFFSMPGETSNVIRRAAGEQVSG